jgi:hypothetical protein
MITIYKNYTASVYVLKTQNNTEKMPRREKNRIMEKEKIKKTHAFLQSFELPLSLDS